jgi:hypothetical protein
MLNDMRNFLVAERPFGAKLIMGFSAISITFMLMTGSGRESPVAQSMTSLARMEIWFALFMLYASTLLYGVFANNTTMRMIGSVHGALLWNGLFLFHTYVSGVGPLRGVYLVFGIFSLWSIISVYETIRIKRTYGVDLTKMSYDMMIQFMKQYRK